VFLYSNIFGLTKPAVEIFIVFVKYTISHMESKDVVSGEVISTSVLNETSKMV
jgi:hypothetical protein